VPRGVASGSVPVKTGHRLRILVCGVAFALLSTGCIAEEAPLDWLRPAGPIARDIGNLWTLVFYAAVVVFFLVEGAIVYSLFRFRARRGDTELPRQTHGNTPLEIAWTIAPAILLAILAVPTVAGIWALAEEPVAHDQAPPGTRGALAVTVTAHQWWWQYDYPHEKVVTANELHIPVDRPVRLSLESNDIIHSFWVPALAGKQDVVPGRTNKLTIEADRPGEFYGTCVEYCGLSHANMRLRVFAHSEEDFGRWVSEQKRSSMVPAGGLAAQGKRILEGQQCATCHTVRGTKAEGTTGPDLTHFASRTTFAGAIFPRTEENLRRWLADAPGEKPGSKMPAGVAEMGLSTDDIQALIAYLQSLR
jgi:cytochrome c oxidase subunit 2